LRGEPVEIAGAVYPTEKLRPPIVATHVDASAEPALRGLFTPSAVLERGGERFGILGVVTEDVPAISSPGPNVRFLDAVSSVQAEADRLRAAGIDVIVSGHDHALLGDPAAVEAVAPGQGERIKGPYPTVTAGADGAPVLVVSAHEWGRWLATSAASFGAGRVNRSSCAAAPSRGARSTAAGRARRKTRRSRPRSRATARRWTGSPTR
jgi:5'-nucleotidase